MIQRRTYRVVYKFAKGSADQFLVVEARSLSEAKRIARAQLRGGMFLGTPPRIAYVLVEGNNGWETAL